MVTGQQIRAARAMLKLSARGLAEAAGISWATMQRMEADDGTPNTLAKNVQAVELALEKAGVEFLPNNGVRLKRNKV